MDHHKVFLYPLIQSLDGHEVNPPIRWNQIIQVISSEGLTDCVFAGAADGSNGTPTIEDDGVLPHSGLEMESLRVSPQPHCDGHGGKASLYIHFCRRHDDQGRQRPANTLSA